MGCATRMRHAAGEVSDAIRRIATGRNILLSFALWLFMLILIWGKPFGIAQLQDLTGGATILDMTFTTSPQQVYAVLDALGPAGRSFDLTRIVPLDLVFPFAYTLFLSVAITFFLARSLPRESPWFRLNLVPLIAGAADYGENAGVIALLLSYPARLDIVAIWTSAMYVIKFIFSFLSFSILFIAIAVWGIGFVRNRMTGKGG
ncbi:MAG TPA: hypothetical protein P5217_06085 [Methanoregulaceae archaeon]|nr:hypothetical protein [Methanoregulaceae archaeon]HPD76569.1 hypothetical protein [Methanoregulaceae archaeon]HRY75832.1 hypothetical protein [Methanoregulaceae archaeon]